MQRISTNRRMTTGNHAVKTDKMDNITFPAKGFLVHGPYENFNNTCNPVISENPLKLSIPNPPEK